MRMVRAWSAIERLIVLPGFSHGLNLLRLDQFHLDRNLFRGRLAPQFLSQIALNAGQSADRLDHMDGDADGARLVGDGAG